MTTPILMRDLSQSSKEIIQAYNDGYRALHDGNVIDKDCKLVPLTKITSKGSRQITPTYYYTFIPFNRYGHSGNPIRVHRFVAYCKFGEEALTKLVRHSNNNSLDNSWDNLILGDTRDNSLDIPEEVRSERARRGGVKKRKLTNEQVAEIRFHREFAHLSHKALATKYGVCVRTIQKLLNGDTYRA